jgi:hypothetical protein
VRRRSTPSRVPLITATVLTVALGTLLAPGQMRLSAADGAQQVVGRAQVTARPADISRGGSRDLVRARSAVGEDKLPPYQVKPAGAPIAKLPPPPPPPPEPEPSTPFTFQVGTLNVLGSQHTAGSGGYGPGTSRAAMLAGAIASRGIDLIGMQEMQDDQLAVMQGRLPGHTIWPGRALGNNGVRLQIAFSDALFELVDTGSITTVFDHQTRPIPYVLLRNRETDGEFYVIDIHNSPRDQEADRDAATGAEIALVNTLRATGRPVLLMGDTNEHTEFFCRVAASTGLVGSNGANAAGGCHVGVGPIKIDWIMGGGGVSFSGHVVDYGAPVPASTDHAFVHATVTVTPTVPTTD